MTIFFTSDTHFGDRRVKQIAQRPFASLDLHDEVLAARWNETVEVEDDIWHLGDFAFSADPQTIERRLGRLNGKKHLIIGNNDSDATITSSGWASVQHYAELKIDSEHCILCHYPFRTWNQIGKGALNLHGHSHGKLKPLPRQIDVGVDVWDFRPVTLNTILAAKGKPRAAKF
jgi:calcineurin-like phosphoesterase family protein